MAVASAYVFDKHIECPHCHHTVEIKRKVGRGATYVASWDKVPNQIMRMVRLWAYDDKLRTGKYTKVQLRGMFAALNIPLTENAAAARISEMLGLGIIEYIPGHKTAPHHTAQPPRYQLILVKALGVLRQGGELKPEAIQ